MARPRKVRAPSGAPEAEAVVAEVAELAVADAATAEAEAPAHEETTKAAAGFTPGLYRITNNTPSNAVFPIIRVEVARYSHADVEIASESQLRAFMADADAVCKLNNWQAGFAAELLTKTA